MARRTSSITIFAAILAALLALWAPAALAHHKDDHPRGGGKAPAYTEDNDSDGVPNAPDPEGDADNKHPSGKDKHEEPGGSGNQGNSESDPDDDGHGPDRSNGGPDKPNGTGGDDLLDQDGNNGCGNDDDFEDDNEGWCGKPTDTEEVDEVQGLVIKDEVQGLVIEDEVQGLVVEKAEDEATPSDTVLGLRLSAAPQPAAVAPAAAVKAAVAPAVAAQGGVLPFTGSSDLLPLVAVALMLIAAGALGLRGSFSSK